MQYDRQTALDRYRRPLLVSCLALGVFALFLVFYRAWDADEFEHLQFTWMLSQGRTPYRDFFEHHTPIFHLLTAPYFDMIRDAGPGVMLVAPFGLRMLCTLFTALTAFVVFAMTRRAAGSGTATMAVALFLSCSFVLEKGIEIRPDSLAALLLAVCAYAIARGLCDAPTTEERLSWALVAGLATGGTLMASQKGVFAVIGLLAAAWVLGLRRHGRRVALSFLGVTLLGLLAAVLPVLWLFARRGALGDFFQHNVVLVVLWPREFAAEGWRWLALVLAKDTLFVGLALLGVALLARRLGRRPQTGLGTIVVLTVVASAIGFVVLPIAQRQYLFMTAPFAAMAAAVAAGWLAERWSRAGRQWLVAALPALVVAYFGFHAALALGHPDRSTIDKLDHVLHHTMPSDTVLTGWSPGVAFRRPAFFYGFPHQEVRTFIPPEMVAGLVTDLRSGRAHPALIDFDADLQALSPALNEAVRALYEPTGVATLWRRRPGAAQASAAP
jgi:dolichyl-phosphate-mannose--protein O-mannosyl transferase